MMLTLVIKTVTSITATLINSNPNSIIDSESKPINSSPTSYSTTSDHDDEPEDEDLNEIFQVVDETC